MKRLLPILLILCMLLCACSNQGTDTTTAPADTTAATEQKNPSKATEASAENDATDPTDVTEAPVAFRNPLNGEPLDSLWTARPYAVMLNNIKAAQPMCSLTDVDMLFEFLVEGGITRCIGLYSDMTDVPHIGSIRSARPYFVDVASGFNAIYVHHGGSDDGYAMINTLSVDDIDSGDADFYRDQDRLNAGYATEHTSFVDGNSLIKAATNMEFTTVYEEGVDYGFQFATKGSTGSGAKAAYIDLRFNTNGKRTILVYDKQTTEYTLHQHSADVIDGNTNELVQFKNVLVLSADTSTYQKGKNTYMDITLNGEGEGYFACNGKVVPITWSREDQYSPFVFAHQDGTPITFGVGKTYVAVTANELLVEFK